MSLNYQSRFEVSDTKYEKIPQIMAIIALICAAVVAVLDIVFGRQPIVISRMTLNALITQSILVAVLRGGESLALLVAVNQWRKRNVLDPSASTPLLIFLAMTLLFLLLVPTEIVRYYARANSYFAPTTTLATTPIYFYFIRMTLYIAIWAILFANNRLPFMRGNMVSRVGMIGFLVARTCYLLASVASYYLFRLLAKSGGMNPFKTIQLGANILLVISAGILAIGLVLPVPESPEDQYR